MLDMYVFVQLGIILGVIIIIIIIIHVCDRSKTVCMQVKYCVLFLCIYIFWNFIGIGLQCFTQ